MEASYLEYSRESPIHILVSLQNASLLKLLQFSVIGTTYSLKRLAVSNQRINLMCFLYLF